MIANKNVLITGGAGFIGSHLAERLSTQNRVTIMDDFSTGTRSNLEELPADEVIHGSVTDREAVTDAVERADIVAHLAAMMGVRRTLERPLEVLEVNIDGTRRVLEAAAEADIERVLVASTSEVYGDGPDPPYAEDDETAPKTNYAVAKVADERFTQAFEETYGLEYTIVRYFNVYGPRQDSSSYGYVVPIFVKQALEGKPLIVHGDGSQTRDFTYIDDAIDCTVNALSPAGRNQVFNVGGGSELTIQELAEAVVTELGGRIEHIDHPRPYTVQRRCADVTKARGRLGYDPEYNIEDGIRALRDAPTLSAR